MKTGALSPSPTSSKATQARVQASKTHGVPIAATQTQSPATNAPVLELPSVAAPQDAQWSAWIAALAPRAPQTFLDDADLAARMEALKARGVDVRVIGSSKEGRPIHAGTVGHGPVVISVMAAAHPDEPTGSLTALHLLEQLGTDPRFAALLERITLHIVPCANPDGVARNAPWFSSWQKSGGAPPDLLTYFRHVARDLPADDVEFGFPETRGPHADGDARPENRALASWLDGIGRVDHHASLHSMFLGGGALFLVTADELQAHAAQLRFLLGEADAVALPLHDKDRMGQKGFFRLGAGLQTAPTAEAMREFFAGTKTAENFKLNSMQYAQKHTAAPLALVSEIPLVYDARISSMKPAGHTRAQEEERFADGLLQMVARVRDVVDGLRAHSEDPHVAAAVLDLDKRLASAETAAGAQKKDLARYGDAPATEGNVVENDLNLLRREATLLATLSRHLGATKGSTVGQKAHAEPVLERLAELVEEIQARFRLRFPPVEVQMRLQIAAVLAGALGEAPPPPPKAGFFRPKTTPNG
jgi:Zinc carboxypeptidase